jgi:RNA polymerase sigma-70 factor (ECF subfamily)
MLHSGSDQPVPSDTTHHVNRALRGDRVSLEWVVTRFTPLLKAQASWRLGPSLRGQHSPEDIVAEAWLVAIRRLGDLVRDEGRAAPRMLAFLGTTVLNITNRRIEESMSQGAASRPSSLSADDGAFGDLADTVTGAITHAARGEMNRILEEAMERLSPTDREVILLRVVEGLSNQEAAAHIDEPPNTVSQRYRRALAKLREALPGSFLDEFEPG